MDPRIQVISEVSETGQQKLGQLNLRDPQQNWDRLEVVIKGKKITRKYTWIIYSLATFCIKTEYTLQ